LALLLLAGLQGCARREASYARLRIGVSPEPSMALLFIAEERGFFRENGLAVELKFYPSGKRTLEGLFKGEVEMATPADTPVVFAGFERNDFRIAATANIRSKYRCPA
ncbi:MAG: ABC transporter substrate-binding protein, partial [Deltaproteobacteria bacterium]|nr:ABC transporter substrate-binding protein [Deltaproteobacteria bacterium]